MSRIVMTRPCGRLTNGLMATNARSRDLAMSDERVT